MEEVLMFRADDGKMFEDEDECQEYEDELALKVVGGQIALFDAHRKILPLTPSQIEGAFYARIDTKEAFDWFYDQCEKNGSVADGLEWYGKPDIYIWDQSNKIGDTWLSWNKIVEGMNEERNELIKAGILNAWG